jgi:hypothetical protein
LESLAQGNEGASNVANVLGRKFGEAAGLDKHSSLLFGGQYFRWPLELRSEWAHRQTGQRPRPKLGTRRWNVQDKQRDSSYCSRLWVLSR